MKTMCKTVLALTAFSLLLPLFADKSRDVQGLEKTADYQQQAIYNLIQAMKNVKKRIIQGEMKQTGKIGKEKNPFEDKQDFKMPEMSPENNPQVKLQKIIDMQNKVIEDLRKQEKGSGKTASKQEEVGEAAAKLRDNAKLDDEVKKALEKAMKASHEAADLMASDNRKPAEIKALKTLSDLKEAMRELEKASDNKFNKELADAQKKINDMVSKTDEGPEGTDEKGKNSKEAEGNSEKGKDGKGESGEKGKSGKGDEGSTQKELKSLRDKLTEKAKEQHQSGKQKNAERLAELAKEINDKLNGKKGSKDEKGDGGKKGKDNEKSLSKTLRELQKLIARLRLQDKKDSQILADSIAKLEAYSKELEFLEKHPESMTAAEKTELLRDIEMKMFDMMLALGSLTKGEKKGNEGKDNPESSEKLMPELEKMNKNAQEQINKLKNRRGARNAPGFAYDPLVYPKEFKELNDSLHKMLINATLLLKNMETEDLIYIFNPDDIPEKYRKDVAEYFERLSNTGKTRNKGNK